MIHKGELVLQFTVSIAIYKGELVLKTAKWLIVCILRLIILEKRKWFLISYSNSNTFHVESFIRFKSMQSIFVNAFLIKNS